MNRRLTRNLIYFYFVYFYLYFHSNLTSTVFLYQSHFVIGFCIIFENILTVYYSFKVNFCIRWWRLVLPNLEIIGKYITIRLPLPLILKTYECIGPLNAWIKPTGSFLSDLWCRDSNARRLLKWELKHN